MKFACVWHFLFFFVCFSMLLFFLNTWYSQVDRNLFFLFFLLAYTMNEWSENENILSSPLRLLRMKRKFDRWCMLQFCVSLIDSSRLKEAQLQFLFDKVEKESSAATIMRWAGFIFVRLVMIAICFPFYSINLYKQINKYNKI